MRRTVDGTGNRPQLAGFKRETTVDRRGLFYSCERYFEAFAVAVAVLALSCFMNSRILVIEPGLRFSAQAS